MDKDLFFFSELIASGIRPTEKIEDEFLRLDKYCRWRNASPVQNNRYHLLPHDEPSNTREILNKVRDEFVERLITVGHISVKPSRIEGAPSKFYYSDRANNNAQVIGHPKISYIFNEVLKGVPFEKLEDKDGHVWGLRKEITDEKAKKLVDAIISFIKYNKNEEQDHFNTLPPVSF